jgi:hypothetical protein
LLVNLSVADNNLNEETTSLRENFLNTIKDDKYLNEVVSTFVISYNN